MNASCWLMLALGGCTSSTELLSKSANTAACVAPGPAIHLGGTAAANCAGALAAQNGRYALCTCDDLTFTNPFSVSAVSSMMQPGGAPAPTTALGSDGSINAMNMIDVNGPVIAAGGSGLSFGNGGHVVGNAHVGGPLSVTAGGATFDADAYVAGDLSGNVMIGGTLHVPTTATVGPMVMAHNVAREAVSVSAPCDCAAGPVFDIAAAVAAAKAANNNAQLGFSTDALTAATSAQTLDLSCGEFYFAAINTAKNAPIMLHVHGNVALFVAGDMTVDDNFSVMLDSGAALDIVVAGSFFGEGAVFGSPTSPAQLRLWVGGATVSLPAQSQFGATVYAPAAVLEAQPGLSFRGALFVKTFSAVGSLMLEYDPAVLQAGQACGIAAPATID